MRHWKVICTEGPSIPYIAGATWMDALARVLEDGRREEELTRLVCERLPNGTVIARDAGSGTRWVVKEAEAPARYETWAASVVTVVLALAAGLAAHGLP